MINTSLLNWKPSEIFETPLLSRLFDWDLHSTPHMPESDMYESDTAYIFKVATPGVNVEDVRTTIENNVLTVRGETKSENIENSTKVYRREMRYGSFSRSFHLPENIVAELAKATIKNGVTTVEVPKRQVESQSLPAFEVPVTT